MFGVVGFFRALGLEAVSVVVPVGVLGSVYLAGGFARHLDVQAAQRIGLIPPLEPDRVIQVGNAAIEGAGRALISRTSRVQLENLVGNIEHVELEAEPDFFDYFVTGCQFAPLEPIPTDTISDM
jgi:uncharacterized 2Fe-2S/4Fe-4S cluster protein (DUF4445 family)